MMRPDVEIVRSVAEHRHDGADPIAVDRLISLGLMTRGVAPEPTLAREWLAKRDRTPRGFDPKLVTPRAPAKSNPEHYQRDGIEPIDVIEAWGLDFRLANAIKYIARAGRKPGESRDADLKKAADYLHRARFGRWPWQESDRG